MTVSCSLISLKTLQVKKGKITRDSTFQRILALIRNYPSHVISHYCVKLPTGPSSGPNYKSMIRTSLYTFSFTAEMDSNSITIKRNSSLDHKQHTTFLVQMSNANYSISRSIQLSIYVGMSDCQEDQKDQSQSIKFENLLHSSKS